ncbi:MAG: hypothetical protein H0X72_17340 [Acidobacteria bacterium]|jgi:hypothetical protein|nr:hypothetical protein [Acidobacteriota bacterium]
MNCRIEDAARTNLGASSTRENIRSRFQTFNVWLPSNRIFDAQIKLSKIIYD